MATATMARAASAALARQADEKSNANGNCKRDQRAMLHLVGQAPQRVVAELCRLAADFRRFIAHGVGPAAQSYGHAVQRRSDGLAAACAVLAAARLPTRSSWRSKARKRCSISPNSAEIAREYPNRGNMLSSSADACGRVVVVNSRS